MSKLTLSIEHFLHSSQREHLNSDFFGSKLTPEKLRKL